MYSFVELFILNSTELNYNFPYHSADLESAQLWPRTSAFKCQELNQLTALTWAVYLYPLASQSCAPPKKKTLRDLLVRLTAS